MAPRAVPGPLWVRLGEGQRSEWQPGEDEGSVPQVSSGQEQRCWGPSLLTEQGQWPREVGRPGGWTSGPHSPGVAAVALWVIVLFS